MLMLCDPPRPEVFVIGIVAMHPINGGLMEPRHGIPQEARKRLWESHFRKSS